MLESVGRCAGAYTQKIWRCRFNVLLHNYRLFMNVYIYIHIHTIRKRARFCLVHTHAVLGNLTIKS